MLPLHEHSPPHHRSFEGLCDLLDEWHGDESPESFGPRKLDAIRDTFIQKGNCRRYINEQTTKIIRIIEHGVAREFVSPDKIVALRALPPLKPGQAKDNPKRGGVDLATVKANTRRTFDGYKLMYSGADWDVDGFFVNPADRSLTSEDRWDRADTAVDFYGVYATRKGLKMGTLDFYYLGIDYQVPGASFHTLGSRLAGSRDSVLYEFEGGTQFGKNANGTDHTAGFFTAGLGRKLDINVGGSSWKPTVWAWYDYASGEDTFAEAGRFGDGFDHLFPLAHKYNGFMDLFGRLNLHDLNAQFITPVMGDRVSLLVWYHYFLLDELTTPYNVNMTPFNTTAAAADRELGHEIDVLFNIAINPRNSALLGYSYFNAGDYYDQTSGGTPGTNGIPSISDAQFFYAQYQMRF